MKPPRTGRRIRKPPARRPRRKAQPVLLAATDDISFYVYIAGRGRTGRLTIGATGDLAALAPLRLLWFERLDDIPAAMALADRIGRWPGIWRRQMIERTNPGWRDLARP